MGARAIGSRRLTPFSSKKGGMVMFSSMGKMFLILGISLIFIGLILILIGNVNFPFGKLPGDIVIKRPKIVFIFPITSMILVSIILTLLLNFFTRFLK